MRLSALLGILLISYSSQKSTPEDDSYVAAVLEYQGQANYSINLKNYVAFIEDAARQNADILVFPEMTLTENKSVVVPMNSLLKEYPIPALQPSLYDEVLVTISSAARQSEIYVVINIEEVVDCTNGTLQGESCPERKVYLFNSNVVFDRTGAVIDRYRKINLFAEFTRTPALTPDLGIFQTDFGVTFGHYICFDLLFQVPAVQIVQKHNLTDIVFSVMWFSELPYLTAVQIQQAYAYTMNVNLLAAGANNVRVGSGGSGIFSGKAGALVSLMPGIPTTKLLVSKVPKVPGQVTGSVQGPMYDDPSTHVLHLMTDNSLASHNTRLLTPGFQQFDLADNDVACVFRVNMSERNEGDTYRYRAGAFSGVRTYPGIASGGLRICSIFICTDDTLDSCGKRNLPYSPNRTVAFERLEILAAVPHPKMDDEISAKEAVYFPVSLNTAIMPLNPTDYVFQETNIPNITTTYSFTLTNFNVDLYTFAVWGREYTWDGDVINEITTESPTVTVDEPDSSVVHKVNSVLLAIGLVVLLYHASP